MGVPDYANINGQVLTNGNKHYKVYDGPSSGGIPGKWHVYYDGSKVFLADFPEPAAPINSSPAMNPVPAALPAYNPPAPDPAPAPAAPVQSNPTGGTPAPANTYTPAPASVGVATPEAAPAPASAAPPSDSVPSISAGGSHSQGTTGTEVIAHNGSSSQSGHDNSSDGGVTSSGGMTLGGGEIIVAPARSMAAPAQDVHSNLRSSASMSLDSAPTPAAGAGYTVVSGDNMWDIAQKHGMSLAQLQSLNPDIKNPELILPGQQLNVGTAVASSSVADSGDSAAAFPTTSTYDTTTAAATDANAGNPDAHKIGGWSDGTAGVPNDPTHGIASVAQVQTDPLKINDGKQQES